MRLSFRAKSGRARCSGVARTARTFAGAAAFSGLMALAGCGASTPVLVTPQHVGAYGTASFEGSRDTVFRACLLALQMSGHHIEVAERSMGLVVTEPDAGLLPASRPRRGYVVEVRSSGDGRVTVSATPTSPKEPRHLDPERAAWERLFGDIGDLVRRWQTDAP